jgi:hypothetical protein
LSQQQSIVFQRSLYACEHCVGVDLVMDCIEGEDNIEPILIVKLRRVTDFEADVLEPASRCLSVGPSDCLFRYVLAT